MFCLTEYQSAQLDKLNFAKELAFGNNAYSVTFFKDMNNDGFFHVPEDYQYDLL